MRKRNPRSSNYASSYGTSLHLAGELFKASAGVDIVNVNYKSGGLAMPDLEAGRVQMSFSVITTAISVLKNGRVRALAVTSAKRSLVMPELPAILGSSCRVTRRPAGRASLRLPARRAIVAKLSEEIARIMHMPDVRAKLIGLGTWFPRHPPGRIRNLPQSRIREVDEARRESRNEGGVLMDTIMQPGALNEVARAFRDKTAVAGVGLMLGKFPERTSLSLAIEAFKLALDDAGLKRDDIDGLITLSFGSDYDRFLEATGLNVRYAHQGWTHGRFISPTVQYAAMAVGMGMAKAVAIVNGKRGKAFGQPTDIEMWRQGLGPHGESPAYGALRPAFGAAIAAQRYFHMYGGSNEDLGTDRRRVPQARAAEPDRGEAAIR